MEFLAKVNKKWIVFGAIAVLVIATVIVWFVALGGTGSSDTDNNTSNDSNNSGYIDVTDSTDIDSDVNLDGQPEDGGDEEKVDPNGEKDKDVDLSNIGSLEIEPLSLEVFYAKGIAGFSYSILRTPGGTQYIEFRSEELVGTKCTDDKGTFASILKNPSSADEATVSMTTKVSSDNYGLSLESATCTSDSALLEKYQSSFKTGFGNLRAIKAEE